MINQNEHMPCPVCLGKVEGRSDKRYCSVSCKTKHHRVAFRHNKPMTDEKNKRLLRNHTLLEGIMTNESNSMNIHQDSLIKRGFDIDSCTGVIKNGNMLIYECYGFRYWITNDGILHVVRNGYVSEYTPGFYERYEIDYPKDVRFDRRFRRALERKNNWKRREKRTVETVNFPKLE